MKVLIADDDRMSRRRLEVILKNWKYNVISCENGLEALKVIESEDPPELLILDWMMPGMDGIELCRKVRSIDKNTYSFVLLLTSKNEMSDIVEGMDAGADDYIIKPFHPLELKARIRAGTRIIELTEQLYKMQQALKLEATHDSLTKLWNRAAIMDIFTKELERSKRNNNTLSICMLDIDHFKKINDTYGHLDGDCVLRKVSDILSLNIRKYDSVGRYGGEEFLIVLPDCGLSESTELAERLRSTIDNTPIDCSGTIINSTVSIGICSYAQSSQKRAEEILKSADSALYTAKEKGRNCVETNVLE